MDTNESPFFIHRSIEPYLEGSASWYDGAHLRANELGMSSPHGRWLVTRGQDTDNMLLYLNHAWTRVQETGDVEAKSHSVVLRDQLDLTCTYLEQGWQEGLCVAWGRPPWSVYTYKHHLVRLEWDPAVPYRLVMSKPLCKGYGHSPGDYLGDVEITCGKCKPLLEADPEKYQMAKPRRSKW